MFLNSPDQAVACFLSIYLLCHLLFYFNVFQLNILWTLLFFFLMFELFQT